MTAPTQPDRCGYTLVDRDGMEYPCDQPAMSWRWYQDQEHEDRLSPACEMHQNDGGIRLHAARDRVRDLSLSYAKIETERDQLRIDLEQAKTSGIGEFRATEWAYGQATKAIEKHRDRADQAEAERDDLHRHNALLRGAGNEMAADIQRLRAALATKSEGHAAMVANFAAKERDLVIERNLLRATVQRVEKLAARDEPHNGHASYEGEPECPACWVADIRIALNGGE